MKYCKFFSCYPQNLCLSLLHPALHAWKISLDPTAIMRMVKMKMTKVDGNKLNSWERERGKSKQLQCHEKQRERERICIYEVYVCKVSSVISPLCKLVSSIWSHCTSTHTTCARFACHKSSFSTLPLFSSLCHAFCLYYFLFSKNRKHLISYPSCILKGEL